MRIEELARRHVCILGFGKEGQSTLHAIERLAPTAAITIADANPAAVHAQYPAITGSDYLEKVDRAHFDAIIKSPGIPPHPLFDKWRKDGRLTSATQIFLDTIAQRQATVIGITGSKGKSTTTTLIFEMLKRAGKDALLVGNIGVPVLDFLEHVKKGTLVVQEMSSYQLMDLTRSPQVAVVTSFFPEHLDYHASAPLSTGSTPLERYKDAKAHIARFQTKNDAIFYHRDFPEAEAIAKESPGKKIAFSGGDAPLPLSETNLIGEHNLGNIGGAFLVAASLGAPREACLAAIRAFQGLPHRLQRLGVHHGIGWVDDAISTTPESAIAAVRALDDAVATIILGGQDRGNDFTELGRVIAQSSVRHVILFPGSGPRIKAAIEAAGARVSFHDAPTMEDAVADARARTPKGKTVLLSTASPSYNMFKNFEEKGHVFQKCIRG